MISSGNSNKTYTTIAGDMWDIIAYKVYGDEAYTDKLIKHNLDYIDTVVFSAGIVLSLPDVIIKNTEGIPPWKRG